MEKISKFEDCKIDNLNTIKGGGPLVGRFVLKYMTEEGVRDKTVYKDGKEVRQVTDLDSWFNRDRTEF